MKQVDALYEDGFLKPVEPLQLAAGERVRLIVMQPSSPQRWNLARLSRAGQEEDLFLAEQGLADWAAALDAEDRH